MHRPNWAFIYIFLLSYHAGWAVQAVSASPVAPGLDRQIVMPSGVTVTVPQFWSFHRAPLLLVLRPPEVDTQIAIVDGGGASDALDAAAHAWSIYRPGSGVVVERSGTPALVLSDGQHEYVYVQALR
jgi:hypothetical protein